MFKKRIYWICIAALLLFAPGCGISATDPGDDIFALQRISMTAQEQASICYDRMNMNCLHFAYGLRYRMKKAGYKNIEVLSVWRDGQHYRHAVVRWREWIFETTGAYGPGPFHVEDFKEYHLEVLVSM